MKEQKVVRNNISEYFLVKVNELFVSGREIRKNEPIKLCVLEYDASKFEKFEDAEKIAKEVNGNIVRVIDTDIRTKTYEDMSKYMG